MFVLHRLFEPTPILWEFPKFTLIQKKWSDIDLLIPNPPEDHLIALYGKNWKKPDAHFDTFSFLDHL